MEEQLQQYNPTEKEQATAKWAYDNFQVMWDVHNRKYPQFGDRTLLQYLDDSRKTLNLYALPRADGRSNIKSVTPLNKMMAILARVALQRPEITVTATTNSNVIDRKRGEILKNLYKWSDENIDREEDGDMEHFFQAFDCSADGTVVIYEGFDSQTHTRKDITKYDPDTGEVEYTEKEYTSDQCISQSIMPEDFFIWNPYLRNVQKQPLVAWRSMMNVAHFKYEFGGFKNSKYVLSREAVGEFSEDSFFRKQWQDRVEKDQVEVIRIFDKWNDRMAIIANGVVLQDSPLPWKHKKYPFAVTIFSPFAGGSFFWGMSLPYKLRGDTQALETLYNLGIEQQKLAVNPPQLTTAENEIENNMILPGRTLIVDNLDSYRELKFSSPDASYFNFIELMSKNIDFASVDPASQGMNASNTTARGQVIAEENARKLLGIFNKMLENLVLQKAKLRIYNIVQFMIVPGREFRVEGANVGKSTGILEMKVIGQNGKGAETPTELQMIEDMASIQGINLERVNFKPSYLNNIKWSVKTILESAFQQGKSLRISLETEKLFAIFQLFPNIFQSASELFFKNFMRTYEDDPQPYLDAIQASIQANQQQIASMQQQQQPAGGGMAGAQQQQYMSGMNTGQPRQITGEITGTNAGNPALKQLVGAG